MLILLTNLAMWPYARESREYLLAIVYQTAAYCCTYILPQLLSSHAQYSVSGIHSEKALEDAVKDYAYPPVIKYIVKYRKELRSTGRSIEVTLQLHISDTDLPMDFPYTAYERIQGS